MPSSDDEQSSECDVLADHQPEFGDLGIRENPSQLGFKRRIDRPEVGGESLRKSDGERIAWREGSSFFRQVDLSDRCFVESLTRRRRVACEASGVAAVQVRDLEPSEFLDS